MAHWCQLPTASVHGVAGGLLKLKAGEVAKSKWHDERIYIGCMVDHLRFIM